MRYLLGVLLCLAAPLAQALSIDAALITQLQGEVSVESDKGAKRPALPFLKLAAGETLQLKAGSKVQVVYFESGRQESWTGAGQVEVAATEGRSRAMTPEVKQLPPLMVKQLAKTPGAGQQGRAGMVVMRSLPTPDKVVRLENQYAEFKKDSNVDDLTPEVFYLSGLIELKEGDRARAVLSMLRARQGEAGVLPIVEYFTPLAESLGRSPR